MDNSKLIEMLRFAYAVEIGAYYAYEGHIKSVKNWKDAYGICLIQAEEHQHRSQIKKMLSMLGGNPSMALNAILYVVGRSISLGCYVMPSKMSAFGAYLMEILGSGIYWKIAYVALECDQVPMAMELVHMAKNEEEHEIFFKKILG